MEIQKNDKIEVTIESLGYRGEGVARIDRVPVFIAGGLPKERVRAHVILVKKDYAIARLTEVISPSADRVKPECPYFGKCGGCSLQHLAYAAQTDYKRDSVRDALYKIARLDAEVSPCVHSDIAYGYRNKLSLPVRKVNDRAAVGLFAYNTHRIVEIDDCPLQTDRIRAVIPSLRALAERFKPYDEESGGGVLRHFVVRDLGGRLSLTVVATRDVSDRVIAECHALGVSADELWLNINATRGNVIMGRETKLIKGESVRFEVMGLPATVHPKGFLQVNQNVADKLYAALIDHVRELAPDTVIDAYSGGGTLTAMIAPYVKNAIGVEIESAAVESANVLARRQGLTNICNICGDCAVVLPELIKSRGGSETDEGLSDGANNCIGRDNAITDIEQGTQTASTSAAVTSKRVKTVGGTLILLDPPRGGCDRTVIDAVNASGAENVIYVSCNPSTLARDLALLDYTPESVTPYDMFPQTPNVETLVVLRRK